MHRAGLGGWGAAQRAQRTRAQVHAAGGQADGACTFCGRDPLRQHGVHSGDEEALRWLKASDAARPWKRASHAAALLRRWVRAETAMLAWPRRLASQEACSKGGTSQ